MASPPPVPQVDPVTARDVATAVENLQKTSVSMGGSKGYFVSMKVMHSTEKLFSKYIADTTDPDSSEIARIQGALREAASANKAAQTALTAKEGEVAQLRQECHDMAVECIRLQKAAEEYTDKEGALAGLKALLDKKEKELGEAKVEGKKAMKGYDPDVAEQAQVREDALRAQVKEIQVKRKELEKDLQGLKADLEAEKAKKADAESKLATAQRDIAVMKSKKAAANKGVPIERVDIKINQPLVASLFGEKGLKILSDLDMARRANLRDYAHDLLQTANSSVATRTLGDLLKLAAEWLKSKAYAAREALRPWLAAIEADLRAGTVRAITIYRDELRRIIGDFNLAKKAHERASGKKAGFSGNAKAAASAAQSATQRVAQNLSRGSWFSRILAPVAAAASRLFRRVRSFFEHPEKQSEKVLFDRDAGPSEGPIAMQDNEPKAKPSIRKADHQSGSIAAMGARALSDGPPPSLRIG